MVLDIYIGTGLGSAPTGLTVLGNRVFFQANDGIHGRELWATDGTPAGTVLVKDINPGAASGSPSELVVLGNLLLFAATDGPTGTELWRTDGTPAGTVLVKDINSGQPSGWPYYLTVGRPRAVHRPRCGAGHGTLGLGWHRCRDHPAGRHRPDGSLLLAIGLCSLRRLRAVLGVRRHVRP
jgi:ELWxxDGT repeat protein